MKYTDFHVCLVDYSCPELCGEWFEGEFPDSPSGRRCVVERVPDRPRFNKSAAHNAGAACAIRNGAEYICFLDADTAIEEGFGAFVRDNMGERKFLIAGLQDDTYDIPSMTGLLVVPVEPFVSVRGFDESFQGWGGEDIEMRFRLHLVAGLDFSDVPWTLTDPIQHDDGLRTKYYEEPDLVQSNLQNIQRVREKIEFEWERRDWNETRKASRLWYRGAAFEEHAPIRSRPRAEKSRVSTSRGAGERPLLGVARRLMRGSLMEIAEEGGT